MQIKAWAKRRGQIVNSISLSKNQSKGPISTPLIKPVYYGMDEKVTNDDNHILSKLKGGIKTTKDIKINGVQLIEKLGERPLTGQFSILLKKQLEKNGAVVFKTQGRIDGAGLYGSGIGIENYKKADNRSRKYVDKISRDEKKIAEQNINNNRNEVLNPAEN
jgi:hypothetical protein